MTSRARGRRRRPDALMRALGVCPAGAPRARTAGSARCGAVSVHPGCGDLVHSRRYSLCTGPSARALGRLLAEIQNKSARRGRPARQIWTRNLIFTSPLRSNLAGDFARILACGPAGVLPSVTVGRGASGFTRTPHSREEGGASHSRLLRTSDFPAFSRSSSSRASNPPRITDSEHLPAI